MSTAIHEESLASLVPGGDLSNIQLAEFPGLVLAVDVGDPEADPPVEPSVTAKDADGEEVTPPTWQAVLGALRYTPGTWNPRQPSAVFPPRIDPAPRYAGDASPPIEPGATLVKTGAQWIDDVTSEPWEPGTVDLRTEWRYSDDTPAPGKHNDGEYLVDARDVGMTIKVVEMAGDTISESTGIGPIQPGTGGSAPLVDANGNVLDQAQQPPEAIMPPPPFVAVDEPTGDPTFLATEAVAGAPGTFNPPGCQIPTSIGDMANVTANPATLWTTGQHVVLGDASTAYWNGTAWTAGLAARDVQEAQEQEQEQENQWPRTHAEMDEWAAENGVEEWSSANLTLAEKQSELEAAGISAPPIETTE